MTQQANVTTLHPERGTPKAIASRKVTKGQQKLRQQALAGVAICGVGVTLVGLSLTHLAHGIEIVTHAPSWEAWAMAVGIDVGFVALEFAGMASATKAVRKAVERFTKPAVLGTLCASAVLNAFAFAWQSEGYMVAPAIAIGLSIPALVYALARVGAALFISTRSE